MQINATTAQFPGSNLHSALAGIHAGVREPLWEVSTEHCQICPQTPTTLTEQVCEQLREQYPHTRFRTHANARCLPGLHLFDLSSYSETTRPYFVQLADRARRLGAPAVSMHAGYRANATLAQMLDNCARVQDIFGDIAVAIEGLYANPRRPQLVDCWDEYAQLLTHNVPLAIDLSHLHIVATVERSFDRDLTRALIASPNTLEIHLSDNDGSADRHDITTTQPWWWPLLDACGPNAIAFTEGNQRRAMLSN